MARRRRRRWVVAAGVALCAAAGAVVGVAEAHAPRIGSVSPSAGAAVARHDPTLSVAAVDASSIVVAIDGHRVDSVTKSGSVFRVTGLELADGRHTVDVTTHASGLLGRDAHRSWSFVVDTNPPALRVAALPRGWVRHATVAVRGQSEPGVTVSVAGKAVRAAADGSFAARVQLADGEHRLAVVARDRAGNRTSMTRTVRVDAHAPAVAIDLAKVVRTAHPVLRAEVSDASPLESSATLDGASVQLGERSHHRLAQGTHTLTVSAVDATGRRTEATHRFLVDSTEQLGRATLVEGARGADVRALQRALRRDGVFHGRATGLLAGATERAVRRFQSTHAMTADGIVGPDTIGALRLHIVIDQSAHRLTLFRDGRRVAAFQVAVGQPAYPTPDGTFYIQAMLENPTWVPPPDAPWAKGAVPIPPGPGNPLGTRWMGLNTPGVGIHGTDDPASIGYSVSHGCIRMQVPDAERLFGLVTVGTTVTIHA